MARRNGGIWKERDRDRRDDAGYTLKTWQDQKFREKWRKATQLLVMRVWAFGMDSSEHKTVGE